MFTLQQLAEIKARLAAATSRPWKQEPGYYGSHRLNQVTYTDERRRIKMSVALCRNVMGAGQKEADADFIAHAPDDLQALIDVIKLALSNTKLTFDNGQFRPSHWSDGM